MAMVSSPDFLRAPERPTAIATLNRQRHLTPSCGGLTPTAERTVGPARISLESLTPRPGMREQYLPGADVHTSGFRNFPARAPSSCAQRERAILSVPKQAFAHASFELVAAIFRKRHDVSATR